ncbi:MAG: Plug domain-containing protein, partial [Leptospiraceae bacterium]|nr:Plug domain-containing protein [Leptospiraceae bacterium]
MFGRRWIHNRQHHSRGWWHCYWNLIQPDHITGEKRLRGNIAAFFLSICCSLCLNACDALFSQVDSTPLIIHDQIASDYLLAQNDATTETNESDENESDSNDSATQSNEQSIDVVAPQPPSSADASPAGSASRINTEAFRGRAVGLDEMIERNSGVRVRRYGGLGSYSTISIRGSNANQVNVYLDGIPLNNAQ